MWLNVMPKRTANGTEPLGRLFSTDSRLARALPYSPFSRSSLAMNAFTRGLDPMARAFWKATSALSPRPSPFWSWPRIT